MSLVFDERAIPGRHTIEYRSRDSHRGFPKRPVDVLATEAEIESFVRDGYLVRERLLPMSEVERLRTALGAAIALDDRLETQGGRAFGGVFIRHLMDKHRAFLDFLDFAPTASVARALLGPSIQMRGFSGRVCYPDDPNQETEWHFHQRVVPDPIPPLASLPQTLDVLLYLDDIDDRNGPLCVMPASHRWVSTDLGRSDFADKAGQVVLKLPAGSAVLASGSLWHRAMPTRPGGTQRRLLLFGYGPAWEKASIYGEKPENGLTAALIRDLGAAGSNESSAEDSGEELRELLGLSGYM